MEQSRDKNNFIIDFTPDGESRALSLAQKSGDLPVMGRSAAMRKVYRLAAKVAPTNSNVLITGETGTGKEVLARTIHALSLRKNYSFVAVNTSAISENLQESELFGHKKGSFTGAVSDREGLFEEANGGTLFLDEIGDTTLQLQVKLLRALENGAVRRVGDSGERFVDVRVIAATNRNLSRMIQDGSFREDLFFRMNVVHIHLPPLREREEDLEDLLMHFLKRYSVQYKKNGLKFSDEALDILRSSFFPGNIRELDNVVHHGVLMAENDQILLDDLPAYIQSRAALPVFRPDVIDASSEFVEGESTKSGPVFDLNEHFYTISEIEKKLIEQTLLKLRGNQSLAALKLGVSRSTLWRKMKEYHIHSRMGA